MDSKKFKLVLAMTVLTVPLAFTACGKDVEEVPVDDTQASVESTVESEVNETIEEDLASEGIEVTPTPEATPTPNPTPTPTPEVNKVEIDTSMADTYYIIIQDQNIYKEPDVNSDVITTCIVDTMITVSGIHEETGMFEVVDANGDIIGYVESGFCDTIKGGYQETMNETPESEPQVDNPSDVADSGSQSDTDTSESTTPQASTSLPSDSNSGYMTDEEIAAMLGITLPDDYDSFGYVPAEEVPEFEMDWSGDGMSVIGNVQ